MKTEGPAVVGPGEPAEEDDGDAASEASEPSRGGHAKPSKKEQFDGLPESVKRSHRMRRVLIIAIIVLVALAGAIGYFGYQMYVTSQTTAVQQTNETTSQTDQVATTDDANKDASTENVKQTDVPALVSLIGLTQDQAVTQLAHGATVTLTNNQSIEGNPVVTNVTVMLTEEPADAHSNTPTVYLGLDANGTVVQVGYTASTAELGYGSLSFKTRLKKRARGRKDFSTTPASRWPTVPLSCPPTRTPTRPTQATAVIARVRARFLRRVGFGQRGQLHLVGRAVLRLHRRQRNGQPGQYHSPDHRLRQRRLGSRRSMNSLLAQTSLAFLVSLVVTYAMVPVSRRIAMKIGAIDYPSNRRINNMPVPRCGGIALFVGFMAALAVVFVQAKTYGRSILDFVMETDVNGFLMIAGITFAFLVGPYDDVHQMRAKQKFLFCRSACCIVYFSGVSVNAIIMPVSSDLCRWGWGLPGHGHLPARVPQHHQPHRRP